MMNKKYGVMKINIHLFEFFTDFNDWLDSEEALQIRIDNGIDGLTQPSKALYAS